MLEMTLIEKLSDMYDKILSLQDEVSSRFESGDLDDEALKQGLSKLESQNFAQRRKVELATQDSKKYCLSLEADALAQSTGLRVPTVLRDAHIEAVKKEQYPAGRYMEDEEPEERESGSSSFSNP